MEDASSDEEEMRVILSSIIPALHNCNNHVSFKWNKIQEESCSTMVEQIYGEYMY